MTGKPDSSRAGRAGAVLTVVLSLVALLIVGVLALASLASIRLARVKSDWNRCLGSFEEVMRRYPDTRANAAALALERATAALGIDLAPRQLEGRERPDSRDVATFRRFKAESADYVTRVLERGRLGGISPPPENVSAFLELRSGELEAVRRQLNAGEEPTWEMELGKLEAAPLPNLLGHIDLHKLLAADALAALAEGDGRRALADVEASWRLNGALRDNPMLIGQLISMNAARLQAGVLRHVADVPPVWRDRLLGHDYRQSFLTAMKFEGWFWLFVDFYSPDRGLGVWRRFISPVASPYTRLCLAQMSDVHRRRMERLEALGPTCDEDPSSAGDPREVDLSSWNRLGKLTLPRFDDALARLARLELDLELTARVVELRVARSREGGSWPRRLPDRPASTACPREHWIYTPGEDGGMTLALSRDVTWSGLRGATLPTRVSLRP